MIRRGTTKSPRPAADRRAYRPDRHVYRQLRRGSRRRWDWLTGIKFVIVLILIITTVCVIGWAMY
jgi:hypothetical protein